MGFIIWYKVKIEEQTGGDGLAAAAAAAAAALTGGLPVTISSDIYSGSQVLDADIVLTMETGPYPQQFSVSIQNLPGTVVDAMKSKHSAAISGGKPLLAKIYLGYLDSGPVFSSPDPVMEGIVTFIKTSVNSQGVMVTEIRGQEKGGYGLRTHCYTSSRQGEVRSDDLVREVAALAGTSVDSRSKLNQSFTDFILRSSTCLGALEEIARRAQAPLVIRDNTIFLGPGVGAETGPTLDVDKNIAVMERNEYSAELPEPCVEREDSRVPAEGGTAFDLTVLGEPKLRVGQNVTVIAQDKPEGVLRVHRLVHTFSTKTGFISELTLVAALPGALARRRSGASGLIGRIRDMTERAREDRVAVDMGEVKEYEAGSNQKHVATLYYGQSVPLDMVSPSVEAPVSQKAPQLHHKPIASPFAWHKCGLVVPNYPGMRAVLAHNRELANDAIVHGYVWAESPRLEPPQNEPGDWWLCLPTELGSDQKPTGKGVNDLIDKNGRRAIQTKSLHIMVGSNLLADVGSRPTPPDDNTIVIEHQEGTKITIDAGGKIKIETANKDLELTNGTVSLKLAGASVEVS